MNGDELLLLYVRCVVVKTTRDFKTWKSWRCSEQSLRNWTMNQSKNANNRINPYINRFETSTDKGARGGEGRPKTRQQENVTSSLIKLERIWIKVVDHVVERERGGGERRWEQRVMPRRRRQWRAFMLAAEIETDNSNSSNNQLSCGSVRPSSGTRVLRNFPPWCICEVEFVGSWVCGQGKLTLQFRKRCYTALLMTQIFVTMNRERKISIKSFCSSLSLTSYNLFVS